MKNAASAAGAMRISPSAPMPKRRSQSAAAVAASISRSPSRSTTMMKSLPVP
jgi:hypothetical protein